MEQKAVQPHICAIVMAFNEADSLEFVVREIDSVLNEMQHLYELIIVNDGSLDETGAIADRLSKELSRVGVVHHEINRGLGGAYRTGFAQARGEFMTFFPADGQFPASIIKQFTPLMDNADMVLGYLPNRDSSLLAKSLSRAERILYTLMFGSFPKFQGVIMFRRRLFDELALKSAGRGWTVLMELIIRASRGNYRLISVPIEMRPRISGRSKVNNLPTIWSNLKQVIALRRYL